jgi:Family of unknown function (DUF6428)
MKLSDLQTVLRQNPTKVSRFVLPGRGYIPEHAHVTEVGHVVRTFVDCGGLSGREEKVLLQTHVGEDREHRLRSDRLDQILELSHRVLPHADLEVDVEYDCCVLAQYPIARAMSHGDYVDLILERGRTQCRARERRHKATGDSCCAAKATGCCG